jgi:hypothetical protein
VLSDEDVGIVRLMLVGLGLMLLIVFRPQGLWATGGRRSSVAADPAPMPLLHVQPAAGVAKPDPILVVAGVCRSFGGVRAVDVEHLEVQRGSITALIGPNGAGKTTFFTS